MYTGKPAMFLSRNLERVLSDLNEVGRQAISAHYTGKDEEDIRKFLEDIVLDGKEDPKSDARKDFRRNYLSMGMNGNFSSRVVSDIRKSIWGED